MKKLGFLIAILAAAAVYQASDALALTAYDGKRESFVLGVGAGWGNVGAELTAVEEVDRQNGIVGNFRLGWAVRKDMVVGADFDIWSHLYGDTRWIFNLSALALTYFPGDKDAFINGGVGIGTSRVELEGTGESNQDQAGLGFFVGGGYEWWVAEEVVVGPQIKLAYLDLNGDTTKSANYFSIMIQLTWYKSKD